MARVAQLFRLAWTRRPMHPIEARIAFPLALPHELATLEFSGLF
jgi:hypothetical protein